MITQQEFEAILADDTKRITDDIDWVEDRAHRPAVVFRVAITSDRGYPLQVAGRWNSMAGKLSYSLLYQGVGRVYGLDMGVPHRNPTGQPLGDLHKHSWTPEFRDRCAYIPEDITAVWNEPLKVWGQFCAEARLVHSGTLASPTRQGELPL